MEQPGNVCLSPAVASSWLPSLLAFFLEMKLMFSVSQGGREDSGGHRCPCPSTENLNNLETMAPAKPMGPSSSASGARQTQASCHQIFFFLSRIRVQVGLLVCFRAKVFLYSPVWLATCSIDQATQSFCLFLSSGNTGVSHQAQPRNLDFLMNFPISKTM